VLQLTDPPGELGSDDDAPSELVSERTGTVFVVRTNMSLEELWKELGDRVLACEKKGWGEVVVRIYDQRAARAVRSLNERGYPLRRKDRVVYPMYNLRPYGSRGWPTFETSAASIVLAHLTQLKRRKKSLPPLIAQAEASSLKFINIDLIDAPREVAVAQSPEHLLRECKKKLRSKRIFFTGKADMKVVIQLLSDFEDSIAVEFDQMRAKHLKLRTEDLVRARTKELGEARRSRDLKLLQRLTFQEEPIPTLHVSTKAPEPKRVSVLPDAMRLPKPALEQRYPISSSVFVKRSNGEETLANVKEYDAVQQIYTVEINKLGSMKLEKCDEESLRAANALEVLMDTGRAAVDTARAALARAALLPFRGDDSDLNA
jgi:hypothetical protein